jgi:pantothenate kinase
MVEDIYGKNVNNLGLPGDIIASSLAKIAKL